MIRIANGVAFPPMKTKTTGRTAETVSVSMSPEQLKRVEDRIAELSPLVSGTSHYLRLLIEMDVKKNLLGSMLGMKAGQNPFIDGLCLLGR